VALVLLNGAAQAADPPRALRDPMQPPPLARPAAPATADTGVAAPPVTPRHLLLVDGRRYLVDGNRRRGVGDTLGDARIERIEDAAVVVRGPTGLQRLPLFGGVHKQAAPDTPAAPRSARPTGSGDQP
jgi:hypothetical protein